MAPAELEKLLLTHPDVDDVEVIGIPDERMGEAPKAFVVPRPGTTPSPEDIQTFLQGC